MVLNQIYTGSVKDVLGPVTGKSNWAVFKYSDAFSVFDWGRMPDHLPGKGKALAVLASDWFSKLESSDMWKSFSSSHDAFYLRKGCRFGAQFNEIGEKLQSHGLSTHYRGVFDSDKESVFPIQEAQKTFDHFAVEEVLVGRPSLNKVLGRTVADYREAFKPDDFKKIQNGRARLIPLEVVFRYSAPLGSSICERIDKNPQYLSSIGFPNLDITKDKSLDFPVIEFFTKLEPKDRVLTLSEALLISGLSSKKFNELALTTAWVAGWLKAQCMKSGLELADGKMEWAVFEHNEELMLVDALGPDELRILSNGVQLSKEFLRKFYKDSPWYQQVVKSKELADAGGTLDWKRQVSLPPPFLTPELRELGSQIYQVLTNQLTGKKWFNEAWDLEKLRSKIKDAEKTA